MRTPRRILSYSRVCGFGRRRGLSPTPAFSHFGDSELRRAAVQQADEAVDRPRFGPTGHGGGALRVPALRRAPGARSLSTVFDGHVRWSMRLGWLSAVVVLACPVVADAKWRAGYKPRERTWFSYGASYTQPQQAALSFTVMRAMETDVGLVTGVFVQAAPGLDGGKLSVGFGGVEQADPAWAPPAFGAGLKASVLRTWGSP